jgi:hypothetical protein
MLLLVADSMLLLVADSMLLLVADSTLPRVADSEAHPVLDSQANPVLDSVLLHAVGLANNVGKLAAGKRCAVPQGRRNAAAQRRDVALVKVLLKCLLSKVS